MTDWNEAIQAMVAKQEPTPTPPADPYRELREAAETIRDTNRHWNCEGVNAAADTLEANAPTILALLAERDRLEANIARLISNPADTRYWEGRWRDADADLTKAEAALRKSEDRAALREPDWVLVPRSLNDTMINVGREMIYGCEHVTQQDKVHRLWNRMLSAAADVRAAALRAALAKEAADGRD